MSTTDNVHPDHPKTGNAAYEYSDGSQVSYLLEAVSNLTLAGADEQPTHELRCYNPSRKKTSGRTYHVRVAGDDVHLIGERGGSTRSYENEQRSMLPPRHRALLEADGYTVHDEAEHIRPGVVDRVEAWLADQGIDPDDIDVRVNAIHCTVSISTQGYLEGDAWDRYIETMRGHDELQWADTQQVWYVDDEDLPALLGDQDE